MEGFSDGVFGFAITLLVLDLAIRAPGSALEQVLHGWPSYLAYLVSFLTIGAAWLAHTAMTDQLKRADPILLRLNLLLLMVVVFLPFPTRLVAQSLQDPSSERVFVTLYGLTLLLIRVLLFALDVYAGREHLYSTERNRPGPEDRQEEAPAHPRAVRDRHPHRVRLARGGDFSVLRDRGVCRGSLPGDRPVVSASAVDTACLNRQASGAPGMVSTGPADSSVAIIDPLSSGQHHVQVSGQLCARVLPD
jgi:uncharacterized membrane protein